MKSMDYVARTDFVALADLQSPQINRLQCSYSTFLLERACSIFEVPQPAQKMISIANHNDQRLIIFSNPLFRACSMNSTTAQNTPSSPLFSYLFVSIRFASNYSIFKTKKPGVGGTSNIKKGRINIWPENLYCITHKFPKQMD